MVLEWLQICQQTPWCQVFGFCIVDEYTTSRKMFLPRFTLHATEHDLHEFKGFTHQWTLKITIQFTRWPYNTTGDEYKTAVVQPEVCLEAHQQCFDTSRATLVPISAADTNLLPLIFNLNECLYYVTVHNLVFKCMRVYFTTVDNIKVISMCHIQHIQQSWNDQPVTKNPQSNPFETV